MIIIYKLCICFKKIYKNYFQNLRFIKNANDINAEFKKYCLKLVQFS